MLGTGNHAEQGRFTSAVTTDDADDGARRYSEAQVVDQHAVAVGFGDVMELDHLVAQTRAWRNVDLVGFVTGLELAGVHFLKGRQTRLGLGLTTLGAFTHPFQLVLDGFGVRLFLFLFLL